GTYLTLPSNLNAGVTDFTIGMWVRFDKVTPDVWQRIIDIHGTGNRSLYFGMWQYNGGNNVRFGIEDDDGEEQASAFGAFKIGEWVNYTITQSGDTRTLYINGREISSSGASNTADAIGATENNYIGHTIANKVPAEDFNGAIDEFFFVREAMTSSQVLELAVRNMDDVQALDAYKSLTYLKFNGNEAENMFDYYSFDDGNRSVRWSSDRPDLLTVGGVTAGAAVSELTEVTITATITSGEQSDKIDYVFVMTPELQVWDMSMEDVKKRELRRNNAVNYDVNKTYLLKKVGSDEYLTQKDDTLTLTNDPADVNAKWRFADSVHKNAYGIFNVADGLCLDVMDFGTKPETQVILYRGGKGINENWYFIDMGDGISILNYNGNHFLNSTAERSSIESLENAQRWEIIETDRGKIQVGSIIDENTETYETMEEGVYYTFKRSGGYMSTDVNGNLCVSAFNGDNSLWYLTWITDSYYTISNKAFDKNLNINRNSIEAGAGVIAYDKGTAQNEQWAFTRVENGYTIVGAANKNYLCGFGGSFRMEATPQVWTLEAYGSASASGEGTKKVSPLITDYLPVVTTETDYATGIVHPGISINAEDIERIQRHVRNGDEPWATAFNQFASLANTRANPRIYAWDAGGDTTKLVAETRLKNLRNDATTAANQALMYVITGDEVYRTNAINIVRKWSELRDVYAELGSDRIDHGVIAYKLSFAAELLKYTSCKSPDLMWTANDNLMFTGMLETINSKHNRFWHWMNQHGICNTGTMASAIFRNDLEQYKTAVVRTTV
ncbi:MAG: RICIN domain-containing protein, partial [Clostridia bacterium]